MSKKTTGLKEIALAKPTTTLLPKTEVDTQKVEKSTARIHAQKATRISVDLSPELYRRLKHDSFDAGLSLKAFVIQLIETAYESR